MALSSLFGFLSHRLGRPDMQMSWPEATPPQLPLAPETGCEGSSHHLTMLMLSDAALFHKEASQRVICVW